ATKAVLSAINWRGRLLIVGFASGTIPDIPANRALIKGCDIVGIFWGDYIRREPERFAQDFAELTRLYETGRIKPLVSATYPLEKAAEALNVIESRKAVGKIVLKVR